MNELTLNDALACKGLIKEGLRHPSTRKEWAEALRRSENTLRRWESYLLDTEYNPSFFKVYKMGAKIDETEGRLTIPPMLNAYQKVVFAYLSVLLETQFKTVPDILSWLNENDESGRERFKASLMSWDVRKWLESATEETVAPFDFSEVVEDYTISQLTNPCTKEEWAKLMRISVRTLNRWETEIIKVDHCYDFTGGMMQGKTPEQCREEAKAINPLSAQYCHGVAGKNKLDAFQKLYLLAICKMKKGLEETKTGWNNREIREYLAAKVGSGYRCDNLSRSEFKRWLEQVQGGSNEA